MLREPLAWACGKVLHAHDTSHQVAELMRRAELEGATYYQRTDRTLGDLGAGASPARHLVAGRVALPSSPPFFDPRPHLEAAGAPRAAAIYNDPALGELPSSAESSQRSELRRCCLFSVGGARELADRMDSVGMLGLVRASEVRRPGGLFGVDRRRVGCSFGSSSIAARGTRLRSRCATCVAPSHRAPCSVSSCSSRASACEFGCLTCQTTTTRTLCHLRA